MHGLINRAVQCFLRDAYGADTWRAVAADAGIGANGFEAMLSYDDTLTDALLVAAVQRLDRPCEQILEDLGTFLVSHPSFEGLRRLLRFGGVGFVDFLFSLDDLPGRGRLAVPDLDLPQLEMIEDDGTAGRYRLLCRARHQGFGHVMLGVLRAMADDYGALALLEHRHTDEDAAIIDIHLLDQRHASGRAFDLAEGWRGG
ncbi:heme NO-binding domain-containing protein [Alkalilacustris brevis]|uniref:heme NO-binding domain-containing protein n=1 Tax=Alkalilacustris brevis TaxID=2026338 RepID=UPI000E0CC857|nr:heme NO-binding domain-containing protein [Alkalilacustris brevis]